MARQKLVEVIICSIGTGFIFLLTLPSILRSFRSLASTGYYVLPGRQASNALYKDEDGTATPESQAEYSSAAVKIIICVVAALGFATSLASAVLSTVLANTHVTQALLIQDWTVFADWFLLGIQASEILIERSPVRRYNSGILGASSACVLTLVIVSQNFFMLQQMPFFKLFKYFSTVKPFEKLYTVLDATRLGATILYMLANLLLARRPNVFTENGKLVDRQFTVSAFRRYTFGWCDGLLDLAQRKVLELTDLPRPDHQTRAENLQKTFLAMQSRVSLWKSIVLAHWLAFVGQWFLTIFQCISQFGLQFAMLNLLYILELHTEGQKTSMEAWIWTIGLCMCLAIGSWIESWLLWISVSQLAIPVRVQLSALIFQKAMRRKDVKGGQKKTTKADTAKNNDIDYTDFGGTSTPLDLSSAEDEDDDLQGSKQSTINLIEVDAMRVSNFCSFSNFSLRIIIELSISLTFLLKLIGPRALFAGLTAFALTMPLNVIISKKYASAQNRLMKLRDDKMAVVTEAVQGRRQIKFCALERQWQSKICHVRGKELDEQWRVFITETVMMFCWLTGPVLLSAVSLAVYAYLNGELTPSIAFTSLEIFSSLEGILSSIPGFTTDIVDAKVSIGRIQKYLEMQEILENTSPAHTISFKSASVAWPQDDMGEDQNARFVLRNIDLAFPHGQLSVISGKTGSGKSLLLASLLGECDLLEGVIQRPKPPPIDECFDHKATADNWIIPSLIAYVAQIPWIENATIKDNIMFGLPFSVVRYKKTLSACSLERDLDILVDGEMTEIGANGINLSGGQRWRVTLARALYSRAGILVLDDIFGAVDVQVGRWIFENALTGELGQGRTRILATHHPALCLSRATFAVILGHGTIEQAGSIDDLTKSGSPVNMFEPKAVAVAKEGEYQMPDDIIVQKLKRTMSHSSANFYANTTENAKPRTYIEEEHRESGSVKKKIYLEYFRASGGLFYWCICLFVFICASVILFTRSWWVKVWTSSYDVESVVNMSCVQRYNRHTQTPFCLENLPTEPAITNNLPFYMGVYFVLSIGGCLISTLRQFYVFTLAIKGSRNLFDAMIYAVLRTPLRWIDTVPVGRILNRFAADFDVIDSNLANDLSFTIESILQIVTTMAAGLFLSPLIIISGSALVFAAFYIARLYINGAREINRLESNSKSPILDQFGAALTGIGTIRAFGKVSIYVKRMHDLIDDYTTAHWNLWLLNCWLAYRMAIIGDLFTAVVAVLIVTTNAIDASLAGFVLLFSLRCSWAIISAVHSYVDCELDMNAAERICEYSKLTIESQDGNEVPASWPGEGELVVEDLVVGYASDMPPVLRGLTFSIETNQRLGVVGRTGAGKSSLTFAIFRFLEARSGRITIDGVDISKIKLFDLRSRLTIIPQDPALFSGTIRSNLDPSGQYSNLELEDALRRVQLVQSSEAQDDCTVSKLVENEMNINIFERLSSKISDGGLNLSQGQRQLLCLARAIISRPKIMVLDEATSAVDMATDMLIQRFIREELRDSTLIVIAHRLSTIADFDKVLVLSEGKIDEFDSPRALLEKKGTFYTMVVESGEKELLERMIFGVIGDGNRSIGGEIPQTPGKGKARETES